MKLTFLSFHYTLVELDPAAPGASVRATELLALVERLRRIGAECAQGVFALAPPQCTEEFESAAKTLQALGRNFVCVTTTLDPPLQPLRIDAPPEARAKLDAWQSQVA